jgi:hypothetical protein
VLGGAPLVRIELGKVVGGHDLRCWLARGAANQQDSSQHVFQVGRNERVVSGERSRALGPTSCSKSSPLGASPTTIGSMAGRASCTSGRRCRRRRRRPRRNRRRRRVRGMEGLRRHRLGGHRRRWPGRRSRRLGRGRRRKPRRGGRGRRRRRRHRSGVERRRRVRGRRQRFGRGHIVAGHVVSERTIVARRRRGQLRSCRRSPDLGRAGSWRRRGQC